MKPSILKIKSFFLTHKVSSIVFLIIFLLVGFWGYKKITSTTGDTRYLTSRVQKSNIIASVSGTGQVSADSQIDIKPKISGDVIYLGTDNGRQVGAGTLIAELDPKDAQSAVRDAETNLQAAKLSLDKITLQNSNKNINSSVDKAYEDGFRSVSSVFLDFPSVLNGLENMLNESNLSDNSARTSGKTALNFRNLAETSYYNANSSYEKTRNDYRLLSNNSSRTDIENIINETYTTTSLISDAIKNYINYVNFMVEDKNDSTGFSTDQTTLSTYSNTISSDLSSLLSAKTNISNAKDTLPSANLDLESAQLVVTQKENTLQDAKNKLSDYFIRAPFAGTIANMTIKKSDSVSANTVVATLITNKQIAEISLNEVDVAKIKVGEKATLTFDAVPNLSISGVVEEIDSIGTVSQGVVTYNVKITLDTQDNRIKPAMSVSASIITDMKQDVLVVPNNAVKSQNGTSYVEMFDVPPPLPTDGLIGSISKVAPRKVPVETGLSNDSETEIISGLNKDDEIVTRTILSSATTATAPSIFGSSSTRGGGGAVRVPANGR